MATTPPEFWTHARTLPRLVGPAARRAEAEGWTGVTLGDSQNTVSYTHLRAHET